MTDLHGNVVVRCVMGGKEMQTTTQPHLGCTSIQAQMKNKKRSVPVDAESIEDSDFSLKPTHEEISVVAQQIYEEEGRPDGLADSHWHAAEARLQR